MYSQLLGGEFSATRRRVLSVAANDITDISEEVDKLFLGCEPSG